uniref:UMA domain-containing protein n=1 Tax=Glossina brevipalpis TaxID=37001 RepID=A0A1A9WX04_9MUSC
MLSFFSKKKHNAETPPEDIIQGPTEAQEQNADDFIFIERKNDEDPSRSQRNLYPPMPPVFGRTINNPYPPSVIGNATIGQTSVPYVQDVPFVLAPQLCNKHTLDLTQTQVDGILALLTRQMSVGEQEEYNFALERSIQNECY